MSFFAGGVSISMARWRGFWWRSAAVVTLAGAAVAAGAYGLDELLPREGAVARGVWFDGEQVTGRDTDAAALAAAHAERLLARTVVLRHGDEELVRVTLGELGVEIDVDRAAAELRAVGREGGLQERLDEAYQARQGQVAVSLPFSVALDPLAERLVAAKERLDKKALSARWDFAAGAPKAHAEGELIDVPAAVAAIAQAIQAGAIEAGAVDMQVPLVTLAPAATTGAVAAMDRSVVLSRFETVFAWVGGQAGRAQNIQRAADGINGLVLMPGETISFNDQVGPRSEDNGFAEAGEIYKGEMRMGIGGGTCQVAGTFHAASYLGGLEVVERSPHSRPSGYIRLGLDATVAYPTVDLKMKNPLPFPVVVHARIENKGTLVVEILGHEKPQAVAYNVSTIGIKAYKREIRETSWLKEGAVIKKQGGRQGITIEKTLTITAADGSNHVDKTTDNYPPTTEIYYIGPGVDVAADLPPLPDQGQG
jgi:vancomycin resistance protein YoaR